MLVLSLDDSGIEDWIDDMTIQIEPQLPLEEKMGLPLQSVDHDQKIFENSSKTPVEDCESGFPALPLPDVQPVTVFKKDVQGKNICVKLINFFLSLFVIYCRKFFIQNSNFLY